ncbi:MAG TPA: tetratricopeptide repeat protein [Gemmatimonadaceae bacterium]
MYTIARSVRIHRLAWAAFVIVVPFALAACGGNKADARPVISGKTVAAPPPKTASVDGKGAPTSISTGSGKTELAKVSVTGPVTYDNANEVFKAGHYPEAAAMFERYVADTPSNVFGQYMLGLSSWKAGDFPRAEQAFDRAIALDSTFAKSYFNSGRVLLDLKRAPEALERIEKGLSLDSTSRDGWRLKARAQANAGDLDGAKETYRQLLVMNDEDLWGLNNLGVLMLDSGEFEDALGPLARAVQLKPTAPLFQNNFGMALERSGYPVAAKHAYEAAVHDDSNFTKAAKNLERLRAATTDTASVDEVTVSDLAEKFRLQVKMWKETETPTGQAKVVVKPDSVGGKR